MPIPFFCLCNHIRLHIYRHPTNQNSRSQQCRKSFFHPSFHKLKLLLHLYRYVTLPFLYYNRNTTIFNCLLNHFYHVSADYMLGRTLARDGSMLTAEEILNAAEPGNVLQGSVLATLRGKLITSASGVLFGLLGKLGDKDAINAAADSLGCHIYLLYRLLHRAAGGSTAYFALPEEDCAAGAASAGASLARTDYARALAKLSREKAAFPDMSHETLNSAFPGRSQGMIQVLSTADGQLNRLNQSGLK